METRPQVIQATKRVKIATGAGNRLMLFGALKPLIIVIRSHKHSRAGNRLMLFGALKTHVILLDVDSLVSVTAAIGSGEWSAVLSL